MNFNQDWSKYEYSRTNKTVTYKDFGGFEMECIVAGCEYDLGITLVYANDPDRIRACVTKGDSGNPEEDTKRYNKCFEYFINGIIMGHIELNNMVGYVNSHDQHGLASTCMFRR